MSNSKEPKSLKGLISIIGVVILLIATLIFGDIDFINDILNQPTDSEYVSNNQNGNTVIHNELKIHYIDVGQGDSILLQNEDATILIDGGTREAKDKLPEYLAQNGVKTLNYVISTHPHEDHIGSLDDAINSVDVENVWMPKKTASTKVFESLAKSITDKEIKAVQPEVGTTVQLADMKITVLGPVKDNYKETNDCSLAIKVEYKNNSFVFTGDAEEIAEKDMLDTGIELQADIFKSGHHGSTTSNSKEFLQGVNPTYAVIPVGEGNSYGHPHTEILELFKQNNIIVYRTDRNGTIVATSNGEKITFEVEKGSETGYTDTNKATNY